MNCSFQQSRLAPDFVNGSQFTVHNLSQKPVLMQLVWNSDRCKFCKFPEDSFRPTLKILHLLKQCKWTSSALIGSNFSGVEWLLFLAFGDSRLPTFHNLSNIESCVRKSYEELNVKNSGELPLKVINLEVSGTDLDVFMMDSWKSLSLASGESPRLLITYEVDFSSDEVQRDLHLEKDSITSEAHLPINSMNFLWKISAFMCSAVVVVCLLFFVLLLPLPSDTRGCSIKSEKPVGAISRAGKPSRVHHNTKTARSMKKNKKIEEALVIDIHPCSESSVQENTQMVNENKYSDHQKKTTSKSSLLPTHTSARALNVSEALESQQSVNLKVKVVKERGRRRKRTDRGGLTSTLEVSSSHSGNSTPSSPLSFTDFAPNSTFSSVGAVSEEQNHVNVRKFSFSMNTETPCIGCHSPCATTSSFVASVSPHAPYARAAGPKLSKDKSMEIEGNYASRNEYIYDIWGDHLSRGFDTSECGFQSFFAVDLQFLIKMSSVHSETSGPDLSTDDVDTFIN